MNSLGKVFGIYLRHFHSVDGLESIKKLQYLKARRYFLCRRGCCDHLIYWYDFNRLYDTMRKTIYDNKYCSRIMCANWYRAHPLPFPSPLKLSCRRSYAWSAQSTSLFMFLDRLVNQWIALYIFRSKNLIYSFICFENHLSIRSLLYTTARINQFCREKT